MVAADLLRTTHVCGRKKSAGQAGEAEIDRAAASREPTGLEVELDVE